jgi:hypothetical protein
LYDKSIGLTLDDILHDEIQPKVTLDNQPFTVKMSIALTTAMFVAGLINGIFSFLTFQNEELREVGCGMYLFTSSITSILTISMLIVKFWFVSLTQMDVFISRSIVRAGCISIESVLKLFVYLDGWLNACVAVERAVHFSQGVSFNRAKSKRIARWIIIILPFCIMGPIIHEPIYRKLIVMDTKKNMSQDTSESYALCLTNYSPSIQTYNIAILFFHLVAPLIANLFSTLFIILGVARRRSAAQAGGQDYRQHAYKHLMEYKQLIISPLIILALSSPRLVIALLPGCVNVSRNRWLYLCTYFISFTPSMLVFIIFVLPSEMYRKKFKESLQSWRRIRRQ